MQFDAIVRERDAYARLTMRLTEAMAEFAIAGLSTDRSTRLEVDPPEYDDLSGRALDEPTVRSDPMTIGQVRFELRLKIAQVTKLYERWGFPLPVEHGGTLVFSRHEVERWARSQPDQSNFAAVLRLRRCRLIPATIG